jgi:hypothetical protein
MEKYINIYGQPFHQYRKKRTTTPHLKSMHINKYHDTYRMKWWDLTSVRVLIGRPIEN